MSDTRIKFSGEVDYSKRSAAYGSYKYLRVVPIGQGQAPSIQLGSTVMTQFELPNNVMNLSLSKLSFDLQIPTQTLAKFNNIYGNALALIDRITLTSRSGVILADIPNTHIFGSLVSSVNTKMQDLFTRGRGSRLTCQFIKGAENYQLTKFHDFKDSFSVFK